MKTLFRIGVAWIAVYIIATSVLMALRATFPDMSLAIQTLVMTLILVTLMITQIVPRVTRLANKVFDKE
jgi:antibiotic biosynthesis monooxygenase (ABM) superfamily enzyme